MKKILLASLLCAALTACGGKKDDKKASAQGLTTSTCPVMNGEFGEGQNSVFIATKVEGSQTSYALQQGGNFIPADGQTRSSQNGLSSMRVTCGNNNVEFFVKQDGKEDIRLLVSPVDADHIRVETGGQNVVLARHVDQPQQPGPGPGPIPNPGVNCPLLNGHYVGADPDDSLDIRSRQEVNGQFSYAFSMLGENFLLADGITHPFDSGDMKGTYRLSCGARTVSFAVNLQGQPGLILGVTDLGNNRIKASARGREVELTKRD